MNVALVDMPGGASGDMLLGALVATGASLDNVERALRTIPVHGSWTLACEPVRRAGIAATHAHFGIAGEDGAPGSQAPAVTLAEVLDTLERSGLTLAQKQRAHAIYERLAQAEARVHGTDVASVHFHEVGQTDAILDIAAFCIAYDLLAIEELHVGAFPSGRGAIRSAHGTYPNPAPATLELLRDFETYDAGIDAELVTPTGAAILTALAVRAKTRPALRVQRIGYGAGSRDLAIPNVVRVTLGESGGSSGPLAANDTPVVVAVLEANLDDMSPQHFELALERVAVAGALEVWLAPISMKKSRPAVVLTALAPLEREAEVARAILRETSTLGVRSRTERRYVLERSIAAVETSLGTVRVKTALLDGAQRRSLEYDDVVRIARESGRPVAEVAHVLEKEVDL